MSHQQLVKIIDFWQKVANSDALYPRRLADKINISSQEIVDIIGPRRSGKSFLLKLLIQKIGVRDSCLYINFEDPYFLENNQPQIIEELVEVYQTYFSVSLRYLFFDEVHNIDKWEKAVRKLRDTNKYKIFITGSSSKLLEGELATLLTGRHLSYQLLPLSFLEYLNFKNIAVQTKKNIVLQEKVLVKNFTEYLSVGGFPRVVLENNLELVKQYYDDIIQKDIIERYDIREKDILKKMGIFLLTNSAKTISLTSLRKIYGISYLAASSYLEYFKEAFLLFAVPQFSYSLKTQHKSLKKFYAIDTGLAAAASFRFSEDKGRMLESIVAIHLKQNNNKEVYYYRNNGEEVDFAVKKNNGRFDLIQVAWELDDNKNKKREISALVKARADLKKVDEVLILTFADADNIKEDNLKITVKPVYQWIIENEITDD